MAQGTTLKLRPEAIFTAQGEFIDVGADIDGFVIGQPDAPVVLIAYQSLSCPYCAAFYRNVLPKLRSDYVDKGLVRFVWRDWPRNNGDVSTHAMLRCFKGADVLAASLLTYQKQDDWVKTGASALRPLLAGLGKTEAELDACAANQAVRDHVIYSRMEGERFFHVHATPSVVVNGWVHHEVVHLHTFNKLLQAHLAARKG